MLNDDADAVPARRRGAELVLEDEGTSQVGVHGSPGVARRDRYDNAANRSVPEAARTPPAGPAKEATKPAETQHRLPQARPPRWATAGTGAR